MIILGIESSCDETAASILIDGSIKSNVILSQEIHRQFGGVIPEWASREHDSQISSIVSRALEESQINYTDINAIAVTYGAGLMGALLVGLNYAKGLSIALNIPFVGVNHLEGHLYVSFLSNSELSYPYLSLLVTGGHTQIWEVKSSGNYILHSNTVDDAAGEAFDKGAKILGLPYPGGPEIEKLAKKGNSDTFDFSIPRVKNNPLDFSFSGLKTSLLYKYLDLSTSEKDKYKYDLAASYQEIILNSLFDKLIKVIKKTDINQISVVGGVAANKRFRDMSKDIESNMSLNIYFPPMEYCTDNAAMIAVAGHRKIVEGFFSDLNLKPNPNLALNDSIE